MSEITFTAQGQTLQVVSEPESEGWAVRIYNGLGERVSPVVYRVASEVATDAAMQSGEDLVTHLMLTLKDEAISGRLKLYPSQQLAHLKQKSK